MPVPFKPFQRENNFLLSSFVNILMDTEPPHIVSELNSGNHIPNGSVADKALQCKTLI